MDDKCTYQQETLIVIYTVGRYEQRTCVRARDQNFQLNHEGWEPVPVSLTRCMVMSVGVPPGSFVPMQRSTFEP